MLPQDQRIAIAYANIHIILRAGIIPLIAIEVDPKIVSYPRTTPWQLSDRLHLHTILAKFFEDKALAMRAL